LKELHGVIEVLEVMPAKIFQRRVRGEQFPRSGREDHLTAVADVGYARRQMHIEPNIVTPADKRLACVEPHANPNSPRP